MIPVWTISVLLVLVSSVSAIGEQNVIHYNLKAKQVSKERFDWYRRKIHKSWDEASFGCARLCYDDEQCTGMMVCPDVCHLFGLLDVSTSPAKKADYKTCDVFIMNRCKNNGNPDDNGYCRCPHGYGGPYCETTVQETCYNRWQLLFDYDDSWFDMAASSSFMMKMKFNTGGRRIKSVYLSCYEFNMTCIQTILELSKSSWNNFENSPKRVFGMIKHGKYQTLMTFNISGFVEELDSKSVINTKWFAKYFTQEDDSCLKDGNIGALGQKIQHGSAVPYLSTLFVGRDPLVVMGERRTNIGQNNTKPYLTYVTPPYWYLARYSTAGYVNVLRWEIGVGKLKGNSIFPVNLTFCTDDCWVQVFSVDKTGKRLQGSVTAIAGALLSGHQLRIYSQSVASATKAVYVHGHTITACLEEMMQPTFVRDFSLHGIAQRRMVSSNGQVQIRRYTLETNRILEDFQQQQVIHWFADTREWIKVLSVAGSGKILRGSVADLRYKVLRGASVRILMEFTSGVCEMVDAEHLEISPDGHVAADVIYHTNVQFGDNYDIAFPPASSHHLWSAVITTTGEFSQYLYTYQSYDGQHDSVSSKVNKYTWFVML